MSVATQVVTTAASAPMPLLLGPGGGLIPSTGSLSIPADRIGPPIPVADGTTFIAVLEPTHGRIAVRLMSTGGSSATGFTMAVERWSRLKAEAPDKAHWSGRRDFLVSAIAGGTKAANVTGSTATNNANGSFFWVDSLSISGDVSIGPAPATSNSAGDVAVLEFDRRGAELIVFRVVGAASSVYINIAIEQINAG